MVKVTHDFIFPMISFKKKHQNPAQTCNNTWSYLFSIENKLRADALFRSERKTKFVYEKQKYITRQMKLPVKTARSAFKFCYSKTNFLLLSISIRFL